MWGAFQISSLITASVSLLLGIFVLVRNNKLLLNKLWFLVSMSTMLWSLGLFGVTYATSVSTAFFWQYVLDIGAAMIPAFFLHFVLVLLNKHKRLKKILFFSYGLAILVILFSFTNYFKTGVHSIAEFNFNYWVETGPLYYLFPIYFLLLASFSIVLLTLGLRENIGIKKQQVRYILYVALIGFGGGAFNFLPQFSSIYPFGNYLVGFYAVTVTYAIVKYRLMNVRFIVAKSVLYFLLVAFVSSFFTFVIFLIREIIVVSTRLSELGMIMIASFIIVLFLDPLKRLLSKITDDIFYKGKIDYDQVLKELSLIIAREIDMEVLLTEIRQGLVEQLKLKRVDILVNLDGLKKISESGLQEYNLNPSVLEKIKSTNDIIVLEEYKIKISELVDDRDKDHNELIAREMDELGWSLVVPIYVEGSLNAIIALDYKLSGDLYGNDDINFFNILAPQIAVAIEKSKLYEEIGRFNRELQERVDRATTRLKTANVDLEDRNRYLTITQNISNLISRTLDINNIIQIIADSISTELGYVGGIISFVDEKGEYLYPAAITRSDQASRALALLPKPVSEYKASIKKRENLGVQALKTGSALTSSSFADFFSPPVEKDIADNIQKAIKAITIVGVPIYSENKIIGVIHYLLSSREDQVSQLDYEMMNNLADQIGIVYRNVKLYQKLENTNAELQEANVHLKQLDKAKSEFLSIASHQLRTPTSAIKGYLSMVLEGDFGTVKPEQKKVITDVYESAARLARLINIFLNVSRIEAGRFKLTKQETDMNQLIEGVYTELKQQAETKGLKLELHLPEKAPMIFVDSDKVREVILNLVDNAIKYTQKGKVEVFSELTPEEYIFYTKDTGMGIRQDEVKTLFRKFVRGTGVAQVNTTGSGLGLYIAQRVIREHGGKIWAESDGLEKGSVFKFTIPLTKTKDIKSEHLDQE